MAPTEVVVVWNQKFSLRFIHNFVKKVHNHKNRTFLAEHFGNSPPFIFPICVSECSENLRDWI